MTDRISEPRDLIALPGRIAIILVSALASIGFSSLAPVLPQISRNFAEQPGADTIVRAMITAAGGAMAVGGPIAGFLSERFGERKVLCTALILFTVVGTAGYWLDDIWLLLASRVVVGLALTTCGVSALALLANGVDGPSRNKWLGYFAVLASLGTVAVIPSAAALGSLNWRLVFLLHLAAAPVLILVLALVPAAGRAPHTTGSTPKSRAFPFGLLLLGISCGAFGATLPAFIPFHLASIGAPGPGNVAAALVALTIAAASTSFLYGVARRYLDIQQVFVIAFMVSTAAIVILGLAPSFAGALVGMFFVGCASGLFGPNLSALGALAPPEQRARRIGLARGGYYGAPLVAQVPLEPITNRYGVAGAFWALAFFAAVMAVLMICGTRTHAAGRATARKP